MDGKSDTKTIKWIEGLRGIASFLVILTHLARAWDYGLFSPKETQDTPSPRLLQLPILRIPWQGRIGVTLFAFITGFVCAVKPLRQARAGNRSAALRTVARSAFRRPPRLVLPATIALVIAWGVTQMGGMQAAHRVDSLWLRDASPLSSSSFGVAVRDLCRNFLSTWTGGRMEYDDHQWALLPLLKGAMTVYVALSATIDMQFQYRLLVYGGMFSYYWQDKSERAETFGQQLFFGMLLSDLSQHPPVHSFLATHRTILATVLSPWLIFVGLYLGSYPQHDPEWCRWSQSLKDLSAYIFPEGSDIPRHYTASGVELIIAGIFVSQPVKNILANKFFMWLGRNSFAIYLTHGTLLRTLLIWILTGTITAEPWEKEVGEDGVVLGPWFKIRGRLTWYAGVSVWLGIVYACAHFWTSYVDTWCARVTRRLESVVFEADEKSNAYMLA